MHDADGISSHRRVKNSTLLRSRVEFQIKSFCFFHCLLDRGHFRMGTMARVIFYSHSGFCSIFAYGRGYGISVLFIFLYTTSVRASPFGRA